MMRRTELLKSVSVTGRTRMERDSLYDRRASLCRRHDICGAIVQCECVRRDGVGRGHKRQRASDSRVRVQCGVRIQCEMEKGRRESNASVGVHRDVWRRCAERYARGPVCSRVAKMRGGLD